MLKFRSKDFDWGLVILALVLSVIGIFLIYSAKHYSTNALEREIYVKQMVWLLLGLCACALVFFIPLRFYEVFSYGLYSMGVGVLLIILMVGSSKMGAIRWFSLGGLNIQPSELAKLFTVFALSRYLTYSKRSIYSIGWLAPVMGMALLPALLVLKQPDLGTALVFLAVLIFMLFWAGVPLFYLFLIVSPFISLICAFHWLAWATFFLILVFLLYRLRLTFLLSVGFLLLNLALGMITPLVWNRLHDYQRDRILIFLDPGRDPRGAGYQIIQSKVAIGSGGLVGKGYLQGTQNKLAFLPHQHTDFVFSVLGEEFGLLGSLFLLGLFTFLLVKGIHIAYKARNGFFSNVALGITSILAFQMLVNVGMTVGFLPVTGLPLPFVSYGGSSLLSSWILVGILLAIHYRWYEY
jgi:rod shape determining protein RodA